MSRFAQTVFVYLQVSDKKYSKKMAWNKDPPKQIVYSAELNQENRHSHQLLELGFILTHFITVCMFKKHKKASIRINTHNAECMAVAD